jgi:methylmalonyl-CoA mutase N-terminal domain/subunit
MTGLDADHPFVEDDVGVQGVSCSTFDDMQTLFDTVPINKLSNSVVVTSSAAEVLFAQYILVAKNRGYDISGLRGTIQNDPLHHRWCGYPEKMAPVDLALQTAADIIEFCARKMPKWYPINVNGYDMREWGLDAPSEVAFAISLACSYIDAVLKRGIDIDDFAPRIAFYMSCHVDLFEEVAKLRAARRIWAQIMREKYKAKSEESLKFKFGVHTAGCSLYGRQILNNVVRVTVEALAAILGGAQSVHCCSFDEPVSLPTELAQRIALRTQQILAYEAGVGKVADPLGGSYFVESLTDQIEQRARKIIEQIDGMGGMVGAIESGWADKAHKEGSLKTQREIDRGEKLVVGVNCFQIPSEEEEKFPSHKIPRSVVRDRRKALRTLRRERSRDEVKRSLRVLLSEAEKAKMSGSKNLIQYVLDAVTSGATLGETLGTMRLGFGYDFDPLGYLKNPF